MPQNMEALRQLRDAKWFPDWDQYRPGVAKESRAIVRNMIDALIAVGPEATKKDLLAPLKEGIQAFNRLDGKRQFIDTIEREDICDAFYEVVQATGLEEADHLADRWREW